MHITDKNLTRERLLFAAREMGQIELAIPRRIVAINEWPLLGTGKVDYVTLKRMAVEGETKKGEYA